MRTLENVIEESDAAFVNEMGPEEVEELAYLIREYLTEMAVSAEGLLDPDNEEEILVVPLYAIEPIS